MKVKKIEALKILDSRGQWTLQARITLDNGVTGTASVPSGASIGSFEAKTVPAEAAVGIIESRIAPAVEGLTFEDQSSFDRFLLSLDDSPGKSKLGGNTLLSLSVAFCKAGAKNAGMALYNYVDSLYEPSVRNFTQPIPIFNLINGGMHADNGLDFQEFIVIPNKGNIAENIDAGQKIYNALHSILISQNFSSDVGDEGGFSPRGLSTAGALNILLAAIRMGGYTPGSEVFLGLDCAASRLVLGDVYELKNEGLKLTAKELREFYLKLSREFPLIYLEDPLSENSFPDWRALKKELSEGVDIVGDDLIATNLERIRMAIVEEAVSGVVIKPNQVGTISQTLSAVRGAFENRLLVVASHRSGETSDTFIADFSVGIGAKYLKAGAPARGERVAKYDRLLEIYKGFGEG